MFSRKVLMVVPYKARDLEGHALVGYHLQQQYGCEVVYSNGYGIEPKLLEHRPDALILDHLAWNFKAAQARLAKRLGMKLIVLPTEGFFQNKESAVQVAGSLHGVTQIVDAYLSWGEFQRAAILERGLMSEIQIQTVGCSRFDFYSKPYLSSIQPRHEFLQRQGISNPDAPLIVWTTNTPYVARKPKEIIHRYVKRGGWTRARVRTFLADQTTQFREHSAVVAELAQRHPAWNFIIKVHPAEWIRHYLPLTRRIPNVRLAFDAPIREFLYHCDALLQRNCTTSTEAWMLGKPVLQLEIGTYDARARSEFTGGNHVVSSIDEADRALVNYLAGAPVPAEQERARGVFIAEFYDRIDGEASERCAARIHEELSPPNYTDGDQARVQASVQEATRSRRRREDGRLSNRVKDLLGIDRDTSLRLWSKLLPGKTDGNLGLFQAEAPVAPEMIQDLYKRFSQMNSQV